MLKEAKFIIKALSKKWQDNDEKSANKKNIVIIFIISIIVSFLLCIPYIIKPEFSITSILSLYSCIATFSFACFFLIYLFFVHNHLPQFFKYIFYAAMIILVTIDSPLIILYALMQIFCKYTIRSIELFEISMALLGVDTILSLVTVFSLIYLFADKIDKIFIFLQSSFSIRIVALFYFLLLLMVYGVIELINYVALKFIIKRTESEEKGIRSFVRFLLIFILDFLFIFASITNVFGNNQADIINVITIFTLLISLADMKKNIVLEETDNKKIEDTNEVLVIQNESNEDKTEIKEKSINNSANDEIIKIKEKTTYMIKHGRIIKQKKREIIKEKI